MADSFEIPKDMIVSQSEEGATVVSIRDFMICLGVSDAELAEMDRRAALRKDILSREPWRDHTKFVPCGNPDSGIGYISGSIDWSGTEMEEIDRVSKEQMRKIFNKPKSDEH